MNIQFLMGKIKSIKNQVGKMGIREIGMMIYDFCRNVPSGNVFFFCWIFDKNQQSADFHIHAMMIQHWDWITNSEINITQVFTIC